MSDIFKCSCGGEGGYHLNDCRFVKGGEPKTLAEFYDELEFGNKLKKISDDALASGTSVLTIDEIHDKLKGRLLEKPSLDERIQRILQFALECPACNADRLHSKEEYKKFHPLAGEGFDGGYGTKSKWTSEEAEELHRREQEELKEKKR